MSWMQQPRSARSVAKSKWAKAIPAKRNALNAKAVTEAARAKQLTKKLTKIVARTKMKANK